MRKHFLILMLMALLPLAGFAADNIVVTPGNASKEYGTADPATAAGHPGWFSFTGGSGQSAADIAPELPFLRIQQGEALGAYTYTFDGDGEVGGDPIVVTGTGLLTIKPKDLAHFTTNDDNNKITLTVKPGHESAFVYNEEQVKPTAADFVITVDHAIDQFDGELTPDVDFVIKEYGANNAVGAGTITITGKGNYKGEWEFPITITCPQLSTLGTPEYYGDPLTYNGAAQTPNQFRFGNATDGYITAGFQVKDLTYQNNTNAGTASVTLVGDNALYSGEVTATFEIGKLAVDNNFVKELGANPKYNGVAQAPVFTTLTVAGLPLVNDENHTDYVLSNLGTNAGNYNATLTFASNGNFSGAPQSIAYTIDKMDFDGGAVAIKFTKEGTPNYTYTDADIKPDFEVWYTVDAQHKYKLSTDDYTFVYKDNGDGTDLKNVGAKKLVVTGRHNFTEVALADEPYNVVKKTVKVGTGNLTVGMGADVVPVPSYDGFIGNHSATSLNVNPTYSYTLLDEHGVETATVVEQAGIKAAPVGKYNIHVKVAALNAAAAAAETALKNYEFAEATTPGKLTKMIGQVTLKVTNREITYGDGFPHNGWAVEHVSGLAQEDVAGFIAGLAIDQTKFALVTPAADPLAASATGYDVAYDNGSIVTPSYVITVETGKLKVNKFLITSDMVQFNDGVAYTYTGTAPSSHVDVSPTVAFPGHDLPNDYLPTNFYTTVFDENVNAGTRKARISSTTLGAQNYRFETDVNYTEAECNTLNAEITGFVAAGTPIADATGMTTGEGYSKNYADFDVLLAVDVYRYNTEIGDAKNDPNYKTIASIKEVLPYVEKEYTINKRELTITADDFTGEKGWVYGTDEPDYTASLTAGTAAEGEESLIDALLEGEQPAGFNGKLAITRNCAIVLGDHVDALHPYLVDAEGAPIANPNDYADNYIINFLTGDLTIKKGKIVAKVKNVSLAYGEVANDNTFHLEAVSGMTEADAANFDEIVSYEKAPSLFGYNADNCKAIDTYTLTYAGTTPTATNYEVEIATGAAGQGTLTVTKRPVTFKVISPAEKTYTEALAWAPTVAADAKLVTNADAEYDAATCYSLLAGDLITDLIDAVVVESKNVGENVITLTTKASDIYEIYVLNGVLTINNTGVADIVLNRVAKGSYDDEHANTAASLINTYDNKIANVTFSDFAMVGEKWYPLVLPFATSVKDISAAFGYAVVDIFDGTTANGSIKFKLHMGNIDANTPFIVKVYEDMNMNDANVKFTNVKIEKAYDENGEVQVGDPADVQFVGSYKGKIDGFKANMYYFSNNAELNEYYQGSATNKTYLRPLGAYFVDNANAATREIIIEEADGSTTAISAITVDGAFVEANGWYTVGGVKLEGVPTEKGVYIRNGKKIVIK